jgi:hypothetical protein
LVARHEEQEISGPVDYGKEITATVHPRSPPTREASTTSPRISPPQGGSVVSLLQARALITEVNGRVSELRSKGYDIQSSTERDPYGFVYLRARPMQVR